jgi:predicted flap endonuclease-1-like 5' DNA nuclease
MATEKLVLTKCVLYGNPAEHHLPGTVLDVPVEDVPHFLEKNVATRHEQPAAPLLPSDPGDSISTVNTETGEVEVEEYDLVADLQTLPGITEAIAEALAAAGVESKGQLGQYTVEELITVEGITDLIAQGILAALKAEEVPLRTDGPTLEEWTKSGYPADKYPPEGYSDKRPNAPAPEASKPKGKGKGKGK